MGHIIISSASGGGGGGGAVDIVADSVGLNKESTQLEIKDYLRDSNTAGSAFLDPAGNSVFLSLADSTSVFQGGYNGGSVFTNLSKESVFIDTNTHESVFLDSFNKKSVFIDQYRAISAFLDVNGAGTFFDTFNGLSAFVDQSNGRSAFIDQVNNTSAFISQASGRSAFIDPGTNESAFIDQVNNRSAFVNQNGAAIFKASEVKTGQSTFANLESDINAAILVANGAGKDVISHVIVADPWDGVSPITYTWSLLLS